MRDKPKAVSKERTKPEAQPSRFAKEEPRQIRVVGTWERQGRQFVETVRSRLFHRK